jgi:hypothetical protein
MRLAELARLAQHARRILWAHHIVMAELDRAREFRDAVRRMRQFQRDWSVGEGDYATKSASEREVDQLLAESAQPRGIA